DWLVNLWFGDGGTNALLTTSPNPLTGPDVLLWARYDELGELVGSWDITPPKQPGGSVLILARSPDSRWAAAAVNTQPDGVWDLYLLPIDVEPGTTFFVDTIDLSGIPATSVGNFLSLHLDDQRLVYRREQLIDLSRPVGVGLDNPDANPADIGPSLQHTYSITAAPGDASRLLVTNGGGANGRELRMIVLDGPIAAQPPVLLTEPSSLARDNVEPVGGEPIVGHGLDALGRAWYVYRNTQLGRDGINLVTISGGAVTQRLELAEVPAGGEIADVVFDPQLQLLG